MPALDLGTTDIFLLVILVSTLVVGFFWGAVRSLMWLAAWLIAFLAGSYLQLELGSWLASNWTNFVPSWSEMAAFGLIYLGILLAAPVVIYLISRSNQRVTRVPMLDDLIGAGVALLVAVLGIAGLMIVFATYYDTGGNFIDPEGGPSWTANLFQSLLSSEIGGAIWEYVVPVIGTVLSPILPPDVREVFD